MPQILTHVLMFFAFYATLNTSRVHRKSNFAVWKGLFLSPLFVSSFRCKMSQNGPMPRTIFFDYNATTPLDPAVREAMLPFWGEIWGNPSSVHHVGQRARAALDDARDRAAKVLVCKPGELIFTSGGTESNNLAIFGAARLLKPKGRHLITSAIEHHAVLHCFDYLEKKEGFSGRRRPCWNGSSPDQRFDRP